MEKDKFEGGTLLSEDTETLQKIEYTQKFLDFFYALDEDAKDFIMTAVASNCEEKLLKKVIHEWYRGKT